MMTLEWKLSSYEKKSDFKLEVKVTTGFHNFNTLVGSWEGHFQGPEKRSSVCGPRHRRAAPPRRNGARAVGRPYPL